MTSSISEKKNNRKTKSMGIEKYFNVLYTYTCYSYTYKCTPVTQTAHINSPPPPPPPRQILPQIDSSMQLLLGSGIFFLGDQTVIPESPGLWLIIVKVSHDHLPFFHAVKWKQVTSTWANIFAAQLYNILLIPVCANIYYNKPLIM